MTTVPRAWRIKLLTIDRYRICSAYKPRLIEGMNCHIQQQRTLHHIAETAKVRPEKKISADKSGLADYAISD
ncbi:hypothetical protein D3C78_1345510 [compost metagenome]